MSLTGQAGSGEVQEGYVEGDAEITPDVLASTDALANANNRISNADFEEHAEALFKAFDVPIAERGAMLASLKSESETELPNLAIRLLGRRAKEQ